MNKPKQAVYYSTPGTGGWSKSGTCFGGYCDGIPPYTTAEILCAYLPGASADLRTGGAYRDGFISVKIARQSRHWQ